MPHAELNIMEKRDIFAVKNRMTDISETFPQVGRQKYDAGEYGTYIHEETVKLQFYFSHINMEQQNRSPPGNLLERRMKEFMLVPRRDVSEVIAKGKCPCLPDFFFFVHFHFIFQVAALNYVHGIQKKLINLIFLSSNNNEYFSSSSSTLSLPATEMFASFVTSQMMRINCKNLLYVIPQVVPQSSGIEYCNGFHK